MKTKSCVDDRLITAVKKGMEKGRAKTLNEIYDSLLVEKKVQKLYKELTNKE